MQMVKRNIRKKADSLRGKPKGETAALRSLRAALADFADIQVVAPAVKPDAATVRAIRKAVSDYYRDPKTLERA